MNFVTMGHRKKKNQLARDTDQEDCQNYATEDFSIDQVSEPTGFFPCPWLLPLNTEHWVNL